MADITLIINNLKDRISDLIIENAVLHAEKVEQEKQIESLTADRGTPSVVESSEDTTTDGA